MRAPRAATRDACVAARRAGDARRRAWPSARSLACTAAALLALPIMLAAQRPSPAGAVRDSQAASAPPGSPVVAPVSTPSPVDAARARLMVAPPRRAPVEWGPGGQPRPDSRAPWWTPVASVLVPGTGQAAAGQDRWIAYAALEGVSWLRYLADHREARREQRAYRQIADRVARALFSTGRPPVGSFEYYETMEKWIASGVYDAVPDGDLQPETDTSTYNGAMWLLARQTYWVRADEPPLPESDAYRNAVAFYNRRAIRPEYRWSWRDAQLQQDLYRRTILRSNAASRRATVDLAAVLANHVLSTVDAYITVRLQRRAGPLGGDMQIEATLPWP